jgi:hypothetical protein
MTTLNDKRHQARREQKEALRENLKNSPDPLGIRKAVMGSGMKPIGVGEMSPKQVSRLRNGHKVRVGCGLGQLVVHPERYDAMERVFKKGKKMTIQLTPEELSANRTMSGEGIFGPGFD